MNLCITKSRFNTKSLISFTSFSKVASSRVNSFLCFILVQIYNYNFPFQVSEEAKEFAIQLFDKVKHNYFNHQPNTANGKNGKLFDNDVQPNSSETNEKLFDKVRFNYFNQPNTSTTNAKKELFDNEVRLNYFNPPNSSATSEKSFDKVRYKYFNQPSPSAKTVKNEKISNQPNLKSFDKAKLHYFSKLD